MINQIQAQVDFKILDIKKLDGYDNRNYKLRSDDQSHILKTYPFSDERMALVEAENAALLHLKNGKQAFPKPISFSDGSFTKVLEMEGEKRIIRLLSFLEGTFLGDIASPTPDLYRSLARFLARMNTRLQSFDHSVIKGRAWEWDLQRLGLNKKYISDIPDAHNRNIVRYFFQQFDQKVALVLPELRKSIIHNDANEWNILVADGKISGLIDFGDLAYTPLINELAVALTYACYDKDDPLLWAAPLLEAYHDILPLQKQELDILYYLIAARLCISVCNSAHAKKVDPYNNYATVSENNAWSMLHRWLAINPINARNTFYEAAGFSITPAKPIEESIERRHNVISPILSVSYDRPIHVERSVFQYMYDAHGNTFLDAYNNIPQVGHSHPKVVEAGMQQMAKLNTNTRYHYDLLPEYAERLLAKFPDVLNKVFFVNSGSAASDLAIRMTIAHTGRHHLMVMEHGYHGNTQIGIDISDYKFSNKKGAGQKENILKTPIPNTYRGKYTTDDRKAGKQYAADAIAQVEQYDHPVAAFISEPIVGCGGQVPLAKGYLKQLYPAIRKQGGVCISDEVQTGFGRTGDYFWGFEAQDVVPDMVIIGKPMGNGHPMAAVVTTDEIAESFGKGVEFFSSFGGNPVSCAIGLAVLDVIEEEGLQQKAKTVGDYYQSLLRELQQKYPCIGDVRGSGLFLGVEIVKDGSMQSDTELAHHIKNELRNRHILISTDGPHNSVLKSKPPLCFTKENAKTVVEHINSILEAY
jgi:4-aminobutyrate aminotransferase-like enzyme/Ser/Thr protein kinase RdoA (MazF antagonist)